MFKPFFGICSQCDNEGMLVVKKLWCARCNHENKQKAKKAAGKKTAKYQYVRESTGEKDTFHAVLDNLPDTETVCFVCKTRIAAVTVHNFAHILSKKQYPLFRNNPNNIRLLCHRFVADEDGFQGCHFAYDMQPRSNIIDKPEWQELFELETQLKEEYSRIKEHE